MPNAPKQSKFDRTVLREREIAPNLASTFGKSRILSKVPVGKVRKISDSA
jgi:hypothetical protein